ncbi:hypothetical protein [Risungbinella massiliensis]|uniref:hypothetical protein n=1 Tax=Risungbinella massiliensis TaxID=1329796 RepID=UPI0005CBBF89|nr:hypothetical protein [Risungbinella massiliensis]
MKRNLMYVELAGDGYLKSMKEINICLADFETHFFGCPDKGIEHLKAAELDEQTFGEFFYGLLLVRKSMKKLGTAFLDPKAEPRLVKLLNHLFLLKPEISKNTELFIYVLGNTGLL